MLPPPNAKLADVSEHAKEASSERGRRPLRPMLVIPACQSADRGTRSPWPSYGARVQMYYRQIDEKLEMAEAVKNKGKDVSHTWFLSAREAPHREGAHARRPHVFVVHESVLRSEMPASSRSRAYVVVVVRSRSGSAKWSSSPRQHPTYLPSTASSILRTQ